MESILIGTLGAEPQVITLATALLLRRAPLQRVVVVHTDARRAPIAEALPALRAAFGSRPGLPPLECVWYVRNAGLALGDGRSPFYQAAPDGEAAKDEAEALSSGMVAGKR